MNCYGRFTARLEDVIARRFPYFKETISRQYNEFGEEWQRFFEQTMETLFGDDPACFDKAVEGYGRFSLEQMKLQVKFDKTREYDAKSYDAAAQEVYQNRNYMFETYLPANLLSHFLWRHHYKQHIFFANEFVPLIRQHGGKLFYDVGVGTGFYSKEMLGVSPDMRGVGFDMSAFSLEYALNTVKAFDYGDSYSGQLRDIITDKVEHPASFIVNIEVLEHLEDPQTFLNALNNMLEVGGYGLISAALTAPNADHIYLYNEPREVVDQLTKAGFTVLKQIEDPAYIPRRPTDSVPHNAAFLVSK